MQNIQIASLEILKMFHSIRRNMWNIEIRFEE